MVDLVFLGVLISNMTSVFFHHVRFSHNPGPNFEFHQKSLYFEGNIKLKKNFFHDGFYTDLMHFFPLISKMASKISYHI